MKNEILSFLNGSITLNPEICNGKPTIRGTRITVQTILEFLSAGDSAEEVLQQYPSLTNEDIKACLAFAHIDATSTKNSYKL